MSPIGPYAMAGPYPSTNPSSGLFTSGLSSRFSGPLNFFTDIPQNESVPPLKPYRA